MMFICLYVSGQENRTSPAPDTVKKKTVFTFAALYGSDVNYYGQTAAVKMPYALGYASVKFPGGLYLSGQTYKLVNNAESGLSGLTLSAGYDFDIVSNLSGNLNYSRSFYPANSQFLQSANADMASAGLSYDWTAITTDLTADYAFDDGGALYTTFNIGKYIDLGLSLSSKDYLTLEPSIELVAGTQRFTETVTESSGNSTGDQNVYDPVGGLLKPKQGSNQGRGNQIVNRVIPGSKPGEQTVVTSTSFDLMAYNFTLPLAYNRARYTIEASYQGAIPTKAISDSPKLQSFFNLGFYYSF